VRSSRASRHRYRSTRATCLAMCADMPTWWHVDGDLRARGNQTLDGLSKDRRLAGLTPHTMVSHDVSRGPSLGLRFDGSPNERSWRMTSTPCPIEISFGFRSGQPTACR
jgi:hypothetical protein